MKIIALCCYRDYNVTPLHKHLEPYVDGMIFMADQSMFGTSALYLSVQPNVTVFSRQSQNKAPFAHEGQNRRLLLQEAEDQGADWVLCLDADERMELNFLKELPKLCAKASRPIYTVRVRDIWNQDGTNYRTDGIWGKKRKAVLFPLPNKDIYRLVPGALHQPWIHSEGQHVEDLDFNLYHFGSMTPLMREDRVKKHNDADPEKVWQRIGYDYLKDETGLTTEVIPNHRLWYAV